jgi:ComF family protein
VQYREPAMLASTNCAPSMLPAFTRHFRPSCAVCSLAPGPLCEACEADYFPAARARCSVCAMPIEAPDSVCGRCVSSPPHFHRTTALGDYAPPLDGMVLALKFGARLDLAAVFGQLIARRVASRGEAVVVPVPLSHERMSERGFNQSLQIARAYCSVSGAYLATNAVRRIRHAPPQQTLAREERRRNIRGAFEAADVVRGRQVLVVDDVMTTGSTMDEVARVLLAAGAAGIHAIVVARTP